MWQNENEIVQYVAACLKSSLVFTFVHFLFSIIQMCVELGNNAAADICRVDFNIFQDGTIFAISLKRRTRYSGCANNKIKNQTHTHAHMWKRKRKNSGEKNLDTIGLTLSVRVCNSCTYATYWYTPAQNKQSTATNECYRNFANLFTVHISLCAIVKQQRSMPFAMRLSNQLWANQSTLR